MTVPVWGGRDDRDPCGATGARNAKVQTLVGAPRQALLCSDLACRRPNHHRLGDLAVLAAPLPRHDLGITFDSPSANSQVPCQFTATGSGSPPTGEKLVISNQQQGTGAAIDSNLYFVVITVDADKWHVQVQVGKNDTKAGTPFTLTTWLVSADWVNYLTEVTPGQHPWWHPWWGTPGSPLGAKVIGTVNITRMAGKCPATQAAAGH